MRSRASWLRVVMSIDGVSSFVIPEMHGWRSRASESADRVDDSGNDQCFYEFPCNVLEALS